MLQWLPTGHRWSLHRPSRSDVTEAPGTHNVVKRWPLRHRTTVLKLRRDPRRRLTTTVSATSAAATTAITFRRIPAFSHRNDRRGPAPTGTYDAGVRDSRTLWVLFEPFHALTYFAPEAHHAYEEVGLRGFWRGYFAGRAAPLGPVGPGVATACFYGFHPAFVARALPDVWNMADPPAALAARLSGVDGAIRRLYPDEINRPAFRESAHLLREALGTCAGAGLSLIHI